MTRPPTAAAAEERDRVLDEVVAKMSARGTLSPGMRVVERWARTGREFSLNEIRDELAAVGVDGQFAPGGLISQAIKVGLIVKVRPVVSTALSTHGKEIKVFRGAHLTVTAAREAVTVPVQRDNGGRFTTPSEPCQEPLFEVAAG